MSVRTDVANQDHDVVRITFRTSGVENMKLFHGQSNAISGPSGGTFIYAWKDRDEYISDEELNVYGSWSMYGNSLIFGDLKGRVP